ncbi:MAG TPA: carboxypeptidase regulatory-like domain-containing protein [Gemmatimonadales bacterium]
MLKPQAPPNRTRAWSPLAVSAGVHLTVLAVAAALSRTASKEAAKGADDPAAEGRRVEMIYVPPVEPPPPPVKPPPERPPVPPAPVRPPPQPAPPPVRQIMPEPEPNAPPDETRSTGAETVEKPTSDKPASVKAVATLESEARRIFGRPRLATSAGAGPQARRPMEAFVRENSERCTPQPVAPRDSAGPTEYGMVEGRIFRQDNGRPLAGAHLQMIGTPYVTFTDATGEYHFKFDVALMDNCRTQYVRVSAPGYESRLLVIVIGPNRSEDVRLRRR